MTERQTEKSVLPSSLLKLWTSHSAVFLGTQNTSSQEIAPAHNLCIWILSKVLISMSAVKLLSVFWRLINLQTHYSLTPTGLDRVWLSHRPPTKRSPVFFFKNRAVFSRRLVHVCSLPQWQRLIKQKHTAHFFSFFGIWPQMPNTLLSHYWTRLSFQRVVEWWSPQREVRVVWWNNRPLQFVSKQQSVLVSFSDDHDWCLTLKVLCRNCHYCLVLCIRHFRSFLSDAFCLWSGTWLLAVFLKT